MITKILAATVALLLGLNLYLIVRPQKDGIVYIDSSKLFENLREFKKLKEQMGAEKAKLKANLDTLGVEFQDEIKKYEKNMANMTSKEKELSQNVLKGKQQQYAQYQQATEQKLLQSEQAATQEFLKRVNGKIAEYGKKKGYRLVLTTVNGNIAYGDEGVDITSEVIELLNN